MCPPVAEMAVPAEKMRGPGTRPWRHGIAQAGIHARAAAVAHRGEAGPQRGEGVALGPEGHVGGVEGELLAEVVAARFGFQVHVAVNQAGQHGAVFEVDDLILRAAGGWCSRFARPLSGLFLPQWFAGSAACRCARRAGGRSAGRVFWAKAAGAVSSRLAMAKRGIGLRMVMRLGMRRNGLVKERHAELVEASRSHRCNWI